MPVIIPTTRLLWLAFSISAPAAGFCGDYSDLPGVAGAVVVGGLLSEARDMFFLLAGLSAILAPLSWWLSEREGDDGAPDKPPRLSDRISSALKYCAAAAALCAPLAFFGAVADNVASNQKTALGQDGPAPAPAPSAAQKKARKLADAQSSSLDTQERAVAAARREATRPSPSADFTWKQYAPGRKPWPNSEGLLEPASPSLGGRLSLTVRKDDDRRPMLAKLCRAAAGPCPALAHAYLLNATKISFPHLTPGTYEFRALDLASGKAWRSATYVLDEHSASTDFADQEGEPGLSVSLAPDFRSGIDIPIEDF